MIGGEIQAEMHLVADAIGQLQMILRKHDRDLGKVSINVPHLKGLHGREQL